jgi:hypothetical protein
MARTQSIGKLWMAGSGRRHQAAEQPGPFELLPSPFETCRSMTRPLVIPIRLDIGFAGHDFH